MPLLIVSRATCFCILFLLTQRAVTQEIRSFMLSKLIGWRFQCANTTCRPFYTAIVQTSVQCQTACLFREQCKALSIAASTRACDLFDNVPDPAANMLPDTNIITMIVGVVTSLPEGLYLQ
jgi:hypothetical protein